MTTKIVILDKYLQKLVIKNNISKMGSVTIFSTFRK